MSTPRTSIASRTSFAALAVDSGESSDEEEVVASDTPTQVEAKLTKSALKRAAKLARTEKRQQAKLAARLKREGSANTTSSQEHSPLKAQDPLPPIILEVASPQTVEVPELPTNGHLDPPAESAHIAPPPADLTPPTPEPQPPVNEVPVQRPVVVSQTNGPFLLLPTKSSLGRTEKEEDPILPAVIVDPQEEKLKEKKRQNLFTRTLWTFIMIGGFISLLLMGHVYMILLVFLCQTLVYREVTALFTLKPTEKEESTGKDPWRKTLNWYFFAVTNYFLYGESIIYYFKHVIFTEAVLLPFVTNHRIISFSLYTIGFVGFVMSLKKGYLKQQFGMFCWVHMSLLLIVVSSHFIVNNILEGLIWFFVPASLVICNDVFAYIWGVTFGRTPLIALSPKKTVEGFVGAFGSTMVFGIIWGTIFMRSDYMTCPVRNLGVSVLSDVSCNPNHVFVWKEAEIFPPVAVFLSTLLGRTITTFPYAPYQLHLLFLSCFASLVAPFGGFFASGFKRAFNIKDFGHSIPGHGGMTDRMDCQFLMGIFVYVYYSSLIREHHVTVGSVMQAIVSGLTVDEQLEVLRDLQKYLQKQGVAEAVVSRFSAS